MKRYTFLDERGDIITEVRAENRDEAVVQANCWRKHEFVSHKTDFYSTTTIDSIHDEEPADAALSL
jgi:hypothetical protein